MEELGDCMDITIVLKVKDIEIKLTVDEAKKLAEVLDGLVGEKTREIVYPRYPWRWYPWDWDKPSYTVTTASTWDINDDVHVYQMSG